MSYNHRDVKPGKNKGSVLSTTGEVLIPPKNWAFLAAGDATITKRVKSKGETWVVYEQRGRRKFSKGIWADHKHIITAQKEIESMRSSPEYHKRRDYDHARREAKHQEYVADFFTEVLNFLNFHPRYHLESQSLAKKVAQHATPIGSGTVARTQRIPISKRAEAAVIAWMRHHTTSYESMTIARVKGKRREIRKKLVVQSLSILSTYRNGEEISPTCPLKRALE